MIFLKESLYGWGVCDIPMPRAAYDIFSDRRQKHIWKFFPDRRKKGIKPNTLLNISKMFIEDIPYLHLLLLSIVSVSCMVFIYLGSKIIPNPPEKQISGLVDITVHMIEDIKTGPKPLVKITPPPVKEKDVSIKTIKKLPLQEHEKKPEPKLFSKTMVNKKTKPITIKRESYIHEETFPKTSRRLRMAHKPATRVKPVVPAAPVFDNPVPSNKIDMKTPVTGKRKFEISRVQSSLSHSKTKTFIKQQGKPPEIPFLSNRSQRNYVISRKDQGVHTPTTEFTPTRPVESDEISLHETDLTEKRYSSQKNLMHVNLNNKAPYLSGDITIDEIDPSQLISLNEFNVCIDPQEEFRLKMQLASLLDKPDGCATDGIRFFFKYTESAYTIKVDIYDPQGRLSGDRCEVLGRAIECVKN